MFGNKIFIFICYARKLKNKQPLKGNLFKRINIFLLRVRNERNRGKKNLFERKKEMVSLSNIFVALPGGIGTYDEIFEINHVLAPPGTFHYLGACDELLFDQLYALTCSTSHLFI